MVEDKILSPKPGYKIDPNAGLHQYEKDNLIELEVRNLDDLLKQPIRSYQFKKVRFAFEESWSKALEKLGTIDQHQQPLSSEYRKRDPDVFTTKVYPTNQEGVYYVLTYRTNLEGERILSKREVLRHGTQSNDSFKRDYLVG